MKTKSRREMLKQFAQGKSCAGVFCNDCPLYSNNKCLTTTSRLARIGVMAILRMFPEKKKTTLEVGSKIKFSYPDIDTSKMNITEEGNVLRNETLIKPWQQNMIELLEKNECLEKEIGRLKKLLKNYQEQAICNGFCKNCKHVGNKTLCKECGINNYLWELAE